MIVSTGFGPSQEVQSTFGFASLQLFVCASQGLPFTKHFYPEVPDVRDSPLNVSERNGLRADVTAFDLVPGAGCRNGRSSPGAYRVYGSKGCAVFITPRVHQDPAAPTGLTEFLRQLIRVSTHQQTAHTVRKCRHLAVTALSIERHNN